MLKNEYISKLKTNKAVIVLVVLALFIGFFVGYAVQKNKDAQKATLTQNEYTHTLHSRDQQIENLKLCIENRAKLLQSYTEPYSYKTFGIDSKLLDSTEVTVTKYSFCDYTVVEKTIDLNGMLVLVTYITEINQYSKQFSNPLLTGDNNTLLRDIPTFYGYENNGRYATFVSEVAKNWTEKESYMSKNKIQALYTNNYIPGALNSVSAQFYSSFSVIGSSIFVDVMQTVDYSNSMRGESAAAIQEAKQKLNTFLDTVSLGF